MQTTSFVVFLYIMAAMTSTTVDYVECGEENPATSQFVEKITSNERQNGTIWSVLSHLAVDVFRFQNNLYSNVFHPETHGYTVVILCQSSSWQAASEFVDIISGLRFGTSFFIYKLPDETKHYDIVLQEALKTFKEKRGDENIINSVILFSGEKNFLITVLEAVSSAVDLKWTDIFHITEWIVVSTRTRELQLSLQAMNLRMDHITLLYHQDHLTVALAQKSRTESLRCVARIVIDNTFVPSDDPATHTLLSHDRITNCCSHAIRNIRKHALLYYASQKSIMAGMRVPVAMVTDDEGKYASIRTEGNVTISDGYCVAVLKLLATYLGFSYDFVTAADGGAYGMVKSDGNATGLTGLLARREAALTPMPMSRVENRRGVLDFIPVPITYDVLKLVYRLPSPEDKLDTTYFSIVHPQFILSLVGPLLVIAVVGAILHMVTNACASAKPEIITWRHTRKLYTFPDHIFFHNYVNYPGQSGRILRASWAMFCVILGAAYSAYLVTTFAVKPEELSIKSFKQLLANQEFRFGIMGGASAIQISLMNSTDKYISGTWSKLVDFNKTDPRTFSSDTSVQIQRILAGGYALLDSFAIYDSIPSDYTDIRGYPLYSFHELLASFVAVPKGVFYKDAIYCVLLHLEEEGIFDKLYSRYFPKRVEKISHSSTVVQESKAVNFGRIKLPVYCAAAGVAASFLCLLVELLFSWCKNHWKKEGCRTRSHSLGTAASGGAKIVDGVQQLSNP